MIAAPESDRVKNAGTAASTANANDDRRRRGEEIFKSLLLSSSNSSMASSSLSSSRKSSFRRRDVIKPLALEDSKTMNSININNDNNNSGSNPAAAAVAAATCMAHAKKSDCMPVLAAATAMEKGRIISSSAGLLHRGSNGRNHSRGTKGRKGGGNTTSSCTALVLHPLVQQHNYRTSPLDPPGEAPTNHPIVCTDLMIVRGSGGGSVGSNTTTTNNNNNSRYQNNTVLWMDPKNVHDPDLVDWHVLRRYDDLMMTSSSTSSPSSIVAYHSSYTSYRFVSSSSHQSLPLLLSNPRTRIATISTGFKAAMFFVREDFDTRIYFGQLEDAIGYMGRRGYAKMRPEEEMEWRLVLERAHTVVKVGPTKRKQLYRKGKIVLILKKTITNEKDGDYHNHAKKMMKSRNQKMIESDTRNNNGGGNGGGVLTVRRTPRNKKQYNEEEENHSQATTTTTPSTNDNDDSSSSSASSASTSNNGRTNALTKFKMLLDSAATASTADGTDRTSLGRSTRWPYKSYSEKFLAQQDEEKRQCLLAIIEGRPLLLNGAAPAASTLLLANGEDQQHRRVPIDPDADIIPSSCRSGCNYDDWKSSTSQFEDSTCHGDMATRATMGESNRSFYTTRASSARGSARRGVYGGGVRYFTPDYSLYSESDDDDDDDPRVSEECGDANSLEEADDERGDAVETEGSFSSNMDSASVAEEEDDECKAGGIGGVRSSRSNHDFFVRASKPIVKKESKKRRDKVRKKEKKDGKMTNRTSCRSSSNNRRQSAGLASTNDDSSSLSSNS